MVSNDISHLAMRGVGGAPEIRGQSNAEGVNSKRLWFKAKETRAKYTHAYLCCRDAYIQLLVRIPGIHGNISSDDVIDFRGRSSRHRNTYNICIPTPRADIEVVSGRNAQRPFSKTNCVASQWTDCIAVETINCPNRISVKPKRGKTAHKLPPLRLQPPGRSSWRDVSTA